MASLRIGKHRIVKKKQTSATPRHNRKACHKDLAKINDETRIVVVTMKPVEILVNSILVSLD